MEPSQPDELIIRRHVGDMTITDVERMVERIRVARMRAQQMYEEAQKLAREAREIKTRERLAAQCSILGRELDRLDKTLASVEKRIAKMCATAASLTGNPLPGWERYYGDKGDDEIQRSGTDTEEGGDAS